MNLIVCIKTYIFNIVSNNQNFQHTFCGIETMYSQLIMVISKSPFITFLKNYRNNATAKSKFTQKKIPKLAKKHASVSTNPCFLKKAFHDVLVDHVLSKYFFLISSKYCVLRL